MRFEGSVRVYSEEISYVRLSFTKVILSNINLNLCLENFYLAQNSNFSSESWKNLNWHFH